jgi:hypothetical protein
MAAPSLSLSNVPQSIPPAWRSVPSPSTPAAAVPFDLDSGALSWGVEKVLSTSAKKIGDATQKFTIEVAP